MLNYNCLVILIYILIIEFSWKEWVVVVGVTGIIGMLAWREYSKHSPSIEESNHHSIELRKDSARIRKQKS